MDTIKKATLIESALLKALALRENYNNYIDYVIAGGLMPETKIILEDYRKYYDLYDHTSIDFNAFWTQFYTNWSGKTVNDDDLHLLKTIITTVDQQDPVDAETALIGLVKKQFIDNINKLAETDFNSDEVRKLIEDYENKYAGIVRECDADCFNLEDIDLSQADPNKGITYFCPELQEALGGQVKGDLIFVVAGHGLGKSAFLYEQLIHTFKSLHKVKNAGPILFFNSEGSPSQVFGRILSNIYKDKLPGGYKQVLASQEKVRKHFFKKYNPDLLKIFRSNKKGIGFIRNKVKKYKPSIIFIDMFKGCISDSKNKSEVTSLEDFAQGLRDLSAEVCPIWVTHQAGDSCKYWSEKDKKVIYKRWLDSRDMYMSKDAIQGAASCIIGIGCDHPKKRDRYVHTLKEKNDSQAKFVAEINFKFSSYEPVRNLNNDNE